MGVYHARVVLGIMRKIKPRTNYIVLSKSTIGVALYQPSHQEASPAHTDSSGSISSDSIKREKRIGEKRECSHLKIPPHQYNT